MSQSLLDLRAVQCRHADSDNISRTLTLCVILEHFSEKNCRLNFCLCVTTSEKQLLHMSQFLDIEPGTVEEEVKITDMKKMFYCKY